MTRIDMKYLIAAVPFCLVLASFIIVVVSGANAASDASKGDFQKAAPAVTVACLVCGFLLLVVFALQSAGSHKSLFRSRRSGGGGGSGGMSMPSSAYRSPS